MSIHTLHSCPRCGFIQRIPASIPSTHVVLCRRCRQRLDHLPARRSLAWPASLALAALILYPLAMSLPVLSITKLGRVNDSTIWSGVVTLFADGHVIIATIVLLCSIVIPLGKILGIFILSAAFLRQHLPLRHQALTYQAIEFLGRWGMIDVLLVALLVAAVKLGDWVSVSAGPGIIAFAAVVILSLLSSLTFDPRALWTAE